MSKPKAPTPPNPQDVANAQTGTSIATALANAQLGMVNQRGPGGSVSYNQIGTSPVNIGGQSYDLPRYEQVTELDAAGQQRQNTLNSAQQNFANIADTLSGQIASTSGQPISMEGLPDLTQDFSADRQRVEDALMGRINPQLDRDRQRLETNLANRGIRLGSAAYDRAMDEYGRTSNDARFGAIMNAGEEQNRQTALASGTRAQGLQERMALANDPINRIMAILSGTQVSQPQFQTVNMPNIATTDVAGIQQQNYANQMANYQQQQANRNAMFGGLFDLGAAFLGRPS